MERVDSLLVQGKLDQVERELSEWLAEHPEDASRQLALGVTRLAQVLQDTYRDLIKHGAKVSLEKGNFQTSGEAKPPKDAPQVSYEDARRLVRRFRRRVAKAQKAFELAAKPDARFPVRLAAIGVDLNEDGSIEGVERFSKLTQFGLGRDSNDDARFVLDQTDALMLNAHCHATLGFADFILAYNWNETFEHLGHVFFWNTETAWSNRLGPWQEQGTWQDAVAMLHLIRWPLHNKKRMASAHRHATAFAESVVRATDSLGKETDNEGELFAGPKQTGVVKSLQFSVSDLQQAEAIAKHVQSIMTGETLAPQLGDAIRYGFSGQNKLRKGVNVKRFFLEPREFDLVLMLQGAANKPYREEGMVDFGIWREFSRSNWLGKLGIIWIR